MAEPEMGDRFLADDFDLETLSQLSRGEKAKYLLTLLLLIVEHDTLIP